MIFIKKIYKSLKKIYLSLIIFIIISILLNTNSLSIKVSHILFDSNIDFQYIKSKSKFILGRFFGDNTHYVSSNNLEVKNVTKIDNSYKLELDYNYVITNKVAGIVIFIGNKENLGDTVIISSDDGINYWYSNLENISVNLYDYIDANTILGSIKDNYLYLTLTKDNRYLNYEDIY